MECQRCHIRTKANLQQYCEAFVKEFISTIIPLGATNIMIDREHRLCGNRARQSRLIVVKFDDRESVSFKSREAAIKASLQGSNLGAGIQSKRYREARKALGDRAR